MDHGRKNVCVCYLITTLLISSFVYFLLSQNIQNNKKLERLREDVEELTHLALRSNQGGEEPRQLTELIDNALKKKLSAIWDDIYTVKKQLRATECSSLGGRRPARSADAVGESVQLLRVNFASEDLGARICNVVAVPACGTSFLKRLIGLDYESNPPINILRDSVTPGRCFAFRNNKSEVTIKLAREINIEQVELTHIRKELSPTGETSSAPKAFKVFGVKDKKEFCLGNYEYKNEPNTIKQEFSIACAAKYQNVRFKFESNHGHPNYTCVYKVAVYGKI